MAKLLISDTCDVIIKRDGQTFLSAETQLGSINSTLGISDKIFGGIGNKALAIIKGQKEVTSSFRNAFYDQEILSITQGVEIQKDKNAVVHKREDNLKVVDNAGDLEVALTGTPTTNTAIVRNGIGELEEVAIATNTVTIPTGFAEEGEIVSVTYQEEVTGDIVTLDSDKFGESFEIEFHTIGYDPATNKIIKDIYIQLDHTVPNGDFELSFENGNAIAPEVSFDALTPPNSTEIGRIIEVDRVQSI